MSKDDHDGTASKLATYGTPTEADKRWSTVLDRRVSAACSPDRMSEGPTEPHVASLATGTNTRRSKCNQRVDTKP